jgi:hypothetical protein
MVLLPLTVQKSYFSTQLNSFGNRNGVGLPVMRDSLYVLLRVGTGILHIGCIIRYEVLCV